MGYLLGVKSIESRQLFKGCLFFFMLTIFACTDKVKLNIQENEWVISDMRQWVQQVIISQSGESYILLQRKLLKIDSKGREILQVYPLGFETYSADCLDSLFFISEKYTNRVHIINLNDPQKSGIIYLPENTYHMMQFKSPICVTDLGVWCTASIPGGHYKEMLRSDNDFLMSKTDAKSFNRFNGMNVSDSFHIVGTEFSRVSFGKGKLAIAHALEDFIYIVDETKGIRIDSLDGSSTLIDLAKNEPFREDEDKYSYAASLGRFGKMVYNTRSRLLFRVVLGSQVKNKGHEERRANLLIIDAENGNKNEFSLPGNKYYFDYIYPYKEGILIQRSDKQNDAIFDYFHLTN